VTATEAALERGRDAAGRSGWEPVSVEFNGRLIAIARKGRTEERVVRISGNWLHDEVGQRKDGTYVQARVRDASLRRVAEAMLDGGDELYREAFQRMRDRVQEKVANGNGRKARRKR
jgi:hypothetical protein